MSHPALQKAIGLCQELVDLLAAENKQIHARDLTAIEAGIARKEALAASFERALQELKPQLQAIKSAPAFSALHTQLKDLLIAYNEVARRNVVLLQAAHTSATSFINIVRQAIQPPAPKVYGKDGQMREQTQQGTPLLARSV